MNNYIVKNNKTYYKTKDKTNNKTISEQFFFISKPCTEVTHHIQRNCLDKRGAFRTMRNIYDDSFYKIS